MATYQRRDIIGQQDIGEPGPLPDNLVGLDAATLADLSAALDPAACEALGYTGQGFIPVDDPAPEPEPVRWIHKAVFKQRLTPQERIAIRTAAKTDPVVEDFLDILDSTELVHLDSAATTAGLAYLVGDGLLTTERAAEVTA